MSDEFPTLRIRNWARYQHYTDRNPPWIKLHFELLSSRDWVVLADASRVLAVASMLLASRSDGEKGTFVADPEYMQRVAYLNTTPDFKPLIQCGFLEVLADASGMLASARPETETETETETQDKAETEGARASARTRARRWGDDEVMPDAWLDWAMGQGLSQGDAAKQAETFGDYWRAKAGRDGTSPRWQARWRNWIRKYMSDYAPRKSGNGRHRPDPITAFGQRIDAAERAAAAQAGPGGREAVDPDGGDLRPAALAGPRPPDSDR